ncbi:Hypothetical protein PACV_339 [Pacmanvirus A23]|uniref:Hypothetical protein n=1 Tax=Pacmanvirus A23 TaxID=1932881 RepID=UPI000A093DC7|nr:Hypothetical protein B9W72_gp335 [Pacmanvirus A23]SIP86052.1 Hypothetical protein PACV_339 [Pacmanvirus A23]
MHVNIIFCVLTFIIMIAVILTADSLTTAMLVITLLTNFLVISSHFGKIGKTVGMTVEKIGKPAEVETESQTKEHSEATHETPNISEENLSIYGADYEKWHAYNDSYTSCYDEPKTVVGSSCSERTFDVDTMNALVAQKRARDKKCMDGVALKDANYYREHFGDEFKETEDRIWWGRNEL